MAQQIVVGLYPTELVREDLLEQRRLARRAPGRPGGLRRLVLENRDGTARALRAHAARPGRRPPALAAQERDRARRLTAGDRPASDRPRAAPDPG